MSWNDHDHRGDYAEAGHTRYDYADEHHRHCDLENADERAQRRVTGLQDEVDGLRHELGDALERVCSLEQTVSVNGETLDILRNRVYALEHGGPVERLRYEDEGDEEESPLAPARRLHRDVVQPGRHKARPVMSDFDTLVRLLRRWTHNHDPHVRAAVELLIEHETWIRRADFQRACVELSAREAWIDWQKAREFVDAGSVASTSEMAVLDLAVALGGNRYKFSIMGPANSRVIAQAVARALGKGR
jgi:hypothetical protein